MKSLSEIIARNNEATLKAYREALEDSDWARAFRIANANPDLFPRRAR